MGLIDPAAMARMALGESLTNLMWAAGTKLEHIKASVNWMCVQRLLSFISLMLLTSLVSCNADRAGQQMH